MSNVVGSGTREPSFTTRRDSVGTDSQNGPPVLGTSIQRGYVPLPERFFQEPGVHEPDQSCHLERNSPTANQSGALVGNVDMEASSDAQPV